MLYALDNCLELVAIHRAKKGETFFCPMCNQEVTIGEFQRKTKPGPLEEYGLTAQHKIRYFKHIEKTCEFEPETLEHINLRLKLASLLPQKLNPKIDYVIGNTMIDIYIPEWKLAIDCQVTRDIPLFIKQRISKLNTLGLLSSWVWGGCFRKIKIIGSNNPYWFLNSTPAEQTIIKPFQSRFDKEQNFRIAQDESDAAYDSPRIYVYEKDNEFHWLNFFKSTGRNNYIATHHNFLFTDLGLIKVQTDIGNLGVFKHMGDTNGI